MTAFLLVRHGQTDAIGRVLAGRLPGFPLNGHGRAQAGRLGTRLQAPVHAVYSSPLTRACQTATAIAAPHGLTIHVDPALDEIHFGEWTGQTFAELDRRPDWQAFNARRGGALIPGGESMPAVLERVADALRRLAGRHRGQHVVVVTHGDVIKAALFPHCGKAIDEMPSCDIPVASLSVLSLEIGGPVLVKAIGLRIAE
jgi:broad specificity phosphatase PhoE